MEGAKCDFFPHRRHKHLPVRLLEYITDKAAAVRRFFFRYIGSIIKHPAGCRFFQSRKQPGNSGFAAAVPSCYSHELTLSEGQGNIIKNKGHIFRIAE